jgi:hypothetical protein
MRPASSFQYRRNIMATKKSDPAPEAPAPGIPAKLTVGVPDKTVIVNDNTEVHAGDGENRRVYYGGDEVTIAGPEADDLVLTGHVRYA